MITFRSFVNFAFLLRGVGVTQTLLSKLHNLSKIERLDDMQESYERRIRLARAVSQFFHRVVDRGYSTHGRLD